ncbi:MAG: T9SS type A sorting domain-containing protein [Flavobacteriales bacterium]|nr:T9SS type A sorting domain-containing protein [Flavobacteriales bacterium]
MKKNLLLAFLSIIGFQSFFSQNNYNVRSGLIPQLAPFYHGVASGDPLSDRVIIWTRVTPNSPTLPGEILTVNWRVASDVDMNNIVASGSTTTSSLRDYTVKVDVTGLSSKTCYYYDFSYDGINSIIGRMKTAPASTADSVRFAVVSCSDYQDGYFNAYASIVERNDIDAVIHLGDYIYEYEATPGPDGRASEPANEIISLSDYRTRYSHYRLDADLRNVHQQYAFISVWDDHETANNSWKDGAGNHTPGTEGDWSIRKSSGKQAYLEWMPVREQSADTTRIYRKISYGNLLNLYMLDTRLEGREEQVGATSAETNNPDRTILGLDQYNWLASELQASTAQWNILGQQVMMAPLKALGLILNTDQWDGYPAERTKLYNHILDNNIQNIVVLTGDIHTSWANDLPHTGYNSSTGAGSVGVEYVITSVTSPSSPLGVSSAIISAANPHIKWSELTKKGYLVLDINQERVQGDYWFCNNITSASTAVSLGNKFYVNSGERFLRNSSAESARNHSNCTQAPMVDPTINVNNLNNSLVWIGAYPNPFEKEITVQYNAAKQGKITVKVLSQDGKLLQTKEYQTLNGLNYLKIDGENLNSGIYQIQITDNKSNKLVRMVKL